MQGENSRYSDATSLSLLERLRSQDEAAWVRLTRMYGPLVYRWCRRAGVRATDVADVMQEVFRSVAQGIGRFRRERDGDSFRGWLFGVTRHRIYDHFRTLANNPKALGEAWLHEQPATWLQDDQSSDCDDTSADDRALLVRSTLELIRGEFTENNWQAFWRTSVDQENATDVARQLGMTPGAVRQAKYRVIRCLRRELEDLDDV